MIETTVRGRVNQSQPGALGEMVEHGARGRRVAAKNNSRIAVRRRMIFMASSAPKKQNRDRNGKPGLQGMGGSRLKNRALHGSVEVPSARLPHYWMTN